MGPVHTDDNGAHAAKWYKQRGHSEYGACNHNHQHCRWQVLPRAMKAEKDRKGRDRFLVVHAVFTVFCSKQSQDAAKRRLIHNLTGVRPIAPIVIPIPIAMIIIIITCINPLVVIPLSVVVLVVPVRTAGSARSCGTITRSGTNDLIVPCGGIPVRSRVDVVVTIAPFRALLREPTAVVPKHNIVTDCNRCGEGREILDGGVAPIAPCTHAQHNGGLAQKNEPTFAEVHKPLQPCVPREHSYGETGDLVGVAQTRPGDAADYKRDQYDPHDGDERPSQDCAHPRESDFNEIHCDLIVCDIVGR
eukprot:PhM_4_TR13898/c0_g1_i1/m.5448